MLLRFQADATGVTTTPVVTNIIPLINFEGYRRNAIGYMKASPDGSRIAVVTVKMVINQVDSRIIQEVFGYVILIIPQGHQIP